MKISIKFLDKISYLYLALPLFIFFMSWLNPLLAIVSTSVLAVVLYKIFIKLQDREFEISKLILIGFVILAVLWCFLGGIGCLYYQSPDLHIRNAIFRDLINFSFPVYYDNNSTLVYYFGLFLPAVLVGKLLLLFDVSKEIAFSVANVANLIYSAIGIFLIAIQLLRITNSHNDKRKAFIVFAVFVFFSGLDILYTNQHALSNFHIEWHRDLQYSSNTTLLNWVYNQAIVSWLVVTLFFIKSFDIRKYGILVLFSIFYSPFVFIGIGIFMISIAFLNFKKVFKRKNYLYKFFKKVFCLENILSVFILLPIVYIFYESNTSVSQKYFYLIITSTVGYFCLFEFGLYLFFIFSKFKKNIIFTIMAISLFIFPFFSYGETGDLCMRASIPALFILMIFIIKYLFDAKIINKFKKICLCIILMIGAITPCYEFYRGYYAVFGNIERPFIKDEIKTLNNKISFENCVFTQLTLPSGVMPNWTNNGDYCNYGAIEPERTLFFKYFAKKKN